MVNKLRVRIFQTEQQMGDCAGKDIADCIRAAQQEKEEINIIFAAAPSQNKMLAKMCSEPGIEWERINAFHMDEYIGLDENHPASFRNFLNRTIFEHFPFKSVNLIDGNAENISFETERYSNLLNEHPADICILGVGENGHIAFNDPCVADFNDPEMVKAVVLDECCRNQQVNDGCFPKLEDVPLRAITLTIPTLCRAQYMFCSVPHATKAVAIKNMLDGNVSIDCPASILTRHENAYLYTDSAAASLII